MFIHYKHTNLYSLYNTTDIDFDTSQVYEKIHGCPTTKIKNIIIEVNSRSYKCFISP